MYRLLLALLFAAAVASLAANFLEFGGAALHPRHGDRLARAATRDNLLVQIYTAGGRAVLPALKLDDSARSTAQDIYGAAFAALDNQSSAADERTLTDMLTAVGVYRPGWRVSNVWATPVLFGILLLVWLFRPKAVHSLPNQR